MNYNTKKFWNEHLTIEHRKPEIVKIMMKLTELYYKKLDAMKDLNFLYGYAKAFYPQKQNLDIAMRDYNQAIGLINTFPPFKLNGVIEKWNRMTKDHTYFNANFTSLCTNITAMKNAVDGEILFEKEEFTAELFPESMEN